MKNRILMTMALVATLFTFSNFISVPASTPSNSTPTKEELKAKFTNSKAGQLLIKKIEKQAIKRQEKLAKQLSKAEAKNDVQKIAKIKEKQKAAADLEKTGITLMIAGGITIAVGIILLYALSSGIGLILWSLGGLVLGVGFILWLVSVVSK